MLKPFSKFVSLSKSPEKSHNLPYYKVLFLISALVSLLILPTAANAAVLGKKQTKHISAFAAAATTHFVPSLAAPSFGLRADFIGDNRKAKKSHDGFPVTITSGGYKETIYTKPDRILCLSASSTQMLYAIGAGKQVVGVDKYSTYPKNAPRTSFTGYETSAEDYLSLHPDLVILAFNESNMVAQLNALHIPVLVMPAASTIQSASIQMLQLGNATGHYQAAKEQVKELNTTLHAISARVGNRGKGVTYFIELSPSLYTATSATFIGSIFSLFKMKNVAGNVGHGSNYPQVNSSFLLKSNPDVVILADTVCCGQTPKSFAARPGYGILRAVKDHSVYGVNDSVASEWGPHTLVSMARYIANLLLRRKLKASLTIVKSPKRIPSLIAINGTYRSVFAAK